MTLKTNDHEIECHRAISPDRRRLSGVRLILALGVFTTACTIAPVTERPGTAAPVSTMPPSGYGSLLQSEVSLSLGSRDLEIMVTPLDESVIRVTAPDTEERLRGIAAANRSALPDSARLFLVSFFNLNTESACNDGPSFFCPIIFGLLNGNCTCSTIYSGRSYFEEEEEEGVEE